MTPGTTQDDRPLRFTDVPRLCGDESLSVPPQEKRFVRNLRDRLARLYGAGHLRGGRWVPRMNRADVAVVVEDHADRIQRMEAAQDRRRIVEPHRAIGRQRELPHSPIGDDRQLEAAVVHTLHPALNGLCRGLLRLLSVKDSHKLA